MDLSSDQDLTLAIMNLVGIEEHFFFTAEKTGKKEYYDLLYEVREMRKELLKKLCANPKAKYGAFLNICWRLLTADGSRH